MVYKRATDCDLLRKFAQTVPTKLWIVKEKWHLSKGKLTKTNEHIHHHKIKTKNYSNGYPKGICQIQKLPRTNLNQNIIYRTTTNQFSTIFFLFSHFRDSSTDSKARATLYSIISNNIFSVHFLIIPILPILVPEGTKKTRPKNTASFSIYLSWLW